MNDLASQAGLALRNVRLVEELRASRRRLVSAQDERAKRLERDIHDGAQQQLVALAVKLRLPTGGRPRPRDGRELPAQLQAEATEALENLRDLARGIYPPLLADKGLPAALDAQARKSTLPGHPRGERRRPVPPRRRGGRLLLLSRSLENVAKYATASRVTVSLARTNGHLTFEVTDDGAGFDPATATHGTGLQGMADRSRRSAGRSTS